MSPGGGGDIFAADPGIVGEGARRIAGISTLVADILNRLYDATTRYAKAGGDGQIGAAVRTKYKPVEAQSLRFLVYMADALSNSGGRTANLSRILEDVNSAAADAAAGVG